MKTLEKIAERNVNRLLETESVFDLFTKFSKMYDLSSGNDKLLAEIMLNKIGYYKSDSGCGWIKK